MGTGVRFDVFLKPDPPNPPPLSPSHSASHPIPKPCVVVYVICIHPGWHKSTSGRTKTQQKRPPTERDLFYFNQLFFFCKDDSGAWHLLFLLPHRVHKSLPSLFHLFWQDWPFSAVLSYRQECWCNLLPNSSRGKREVSGGSNFPRPCRITSPAEGLFRSAGTNLFFNSRGGGRGPKFFEEHLKCLSQLACNQKHSRNE